MQTQPGESLGSLILPRLKITAFRVAAGAIVYFLQRENKPERVMLVSEVRGIERRLAKYPEALNWFSVIRAHNSEPREDKIL